MAARIWRTSRSMRWISIPARLVQQYPFLPEAWLVTQYVHHADRAIDEAAAALAAYPDARVTMGEKGLVLHPSRPAISAELQAADQGDTTTMPVTLARAAEHL